jgi:cellulose synthase/poly-beta-1,6-N-acetylglucosamine synthase-like glycosyltransferase
MNQASIKQLLKHRETFLKYPFQILCESQSLPIHENADVIRIATSQTKANQNSLVTYLRNLGDKRSIQLRYCPPTSISLALEESFKVRNTETSLAELRTRMPRESAHTVITRYQKLFLSSALLLFICGLWTNYQLTLFIIVASISVGYFIFNLLKQGIMAYGLKNHVFKNDNLPKNLPRNWPTYTILVPLYKEANVMDELVKNLHNLDYPKDKLQIMILLEENDSEAIEKAQSMKFPSSAFETLIVPKAPIQTKPRACNYGLLTARGEYCVIFDAEDRPDPLQLKKAVLEFRKSSKRTVCLQAKLGYFNPTQNWLTRCFTLEYSFWFNHYLPSLHLIGGPIPLGGTSNHFVTEKLREIGGWDPYNVTEDADLGMRLFKHHYVTGVINSVTLEEANSHFNNWLRQRSRWQKGYVQTFLVHMRDPAKLINKMGWKGFALFLMTFGSNVFCTLVNPFLLLITILSIIRPQEVNFLFAHHMGEVMLINFFMGMFIYGLIHFIAAITAKEYRLAFWSLTIPFYWIIISLGAWKGLLQLITKPFYWEKTIHGLALPAKA